MTAYASPLLPWNARLAHLRFAAALLVLAFHVYHQYFGHWQPKAGFTGFGWLVEGHSGVALFFVLSGYLFMHIALAAPQGLAYWGFLRNRFLRIFPLFLVFFFTALCLNRDAFRPTDLLYLGFSNLGDAPTSKQFMTGAAWTISVEFTFYLVFPFLARFTLQQGPRYLLRLIALLLLLKTGAYLVSERPTHLFYSTLLGRGDQFLIGMLLAVLAARLPRPTLPRWLFPASVLLMLGLLETLAMQASYFRPEPRQLAWLGWPTLEALGWGLVIVSYARSDWQPPAWLDRWLLRGGELSYSLYLWHGLVLFLLHRLTADLALFSDWRLTALAAFLATLTLSWVVSSLSYATLEAPFLNLRQRYDQPH